MANWAYIENNEVVELVDELPTCWRNVSNLNILESDKPTLKSLGWYPVEHNNVEYNPKTQKLVSNKITFTGNIVYEKLDVETISYELLYSNFINELRIKRNKLLQDSDHLVLYDIVVNKGQEYFNIVRKYRQELRDLTKIYPYDDNTVYDIDNVRWPTLPNIDKYYNNDIGEQV